MGEAKTAAAKTEATKTARRFVTDSTPFGAIAGYEFENTSENITAALDQWQECFLVRLSDEKRSITQK